MPQGVNENALLISAQREEQQKCVLDRQTGGQWERDKRDGGYVESGG